MESHLWLAAQVAAADFRDPLLPLWAMELLANAFLYAWLFCMGATVGSFLNVVVYRLPRQKNLAYPGSCCPRCGHPIRGSDNIPLVSWLNLRGRCRDCGGSISPRYFVVELIVAAAFLLVLVAEHYLPTDAFVYHARRLLTPRDGVSFWCMYVTHVGLVTTLIAAVLILGDGFHLPAALFLPMLVVGFVLPLLWPEIRSIPALAYRDEHVWWAGLIDGLAGLSTGLVIALAGSLWRLRSDSVLKKGTGTSRQPIFAEPVFTAISAGGLGASPLFQRADKPAIRQCEKTSRFASAADQ